MFFNKKNKDSSKPELSFVNNVDIFEYNVLSSRPLSFYKDKQKTFLRISTVFMVLSFLFILLGKFAIENKNAHQQTFLTNIYGQTTNYNENESRQRVLEEFFNHRENND